MIMILTMKNNRNVLILENYVNYQEKFDITANRINTCSLTLHFQYIAFIFYPSRIKPKNKLKVNFIGVHCTEEGLE